MNTASEYPTLRELCDLLRAFICQRPGFDPANYYGAPGAYRADSRTAQQHRRDALTMLAVFEPKDWTHSASLERDRAALFNALERGGRLTLKRDADGAWRLDYCTGQYWPTEYRAGACRVLASALWDIQREAIKDDAASAGRIIENRSAGDRLRASFKRWFGAGIASRWFN